MPRVLLIVLTCLASCQSARDLWAIEKTSVAMTTTVAGTDSTKKSDRDLAARLIALVEMDVLADDTLAVVERQQLDAALQQLALSRERSTDESLRLGKLMNADVLVMLELQRKAESPAPTAFLRVVDAKTATIRGITVMSELTETNLEDTAEQFARYIPATIRQPQAPAVTVAVAPFESVGRFDRLRPLELGVRDIVTSLLLARVGVLAPEPGQKIDDTGKPPRPLFQVLQRAGLEQLLRELDLIQTGLVDQGRLPATLPNRHAAFLIKGEIDERHVDGQFLVVIRGDLIDAATAKVRDSFEFQCPPEEMGLQLAVRVDRIARQLGALEGSSAPAEPTRRGLESQVLKDLALRDLHRFRRRSPADGGHRSFRVPGRNELLGAPRLTKPDTPLGQMLLRKSIDRLETVLFIDPDDAEAAYAIGFCHSLHTQDIYQPARADVYLRKASALKPQTELAALALAFLGEISFHDQTGDLDRSEFDATAERLWFAFEKTPEKYRDYLWPRRLELIGRTQRTFAQNSELLEKTIPYVEQTGQQHRQQLVSQVQRLAIQLANRGMQNPERANKGLALLSKWSDGPDPTLADAGRLGLARIRALNEDHLAAAMQFEEFAAKLADGDSPADRLKRGVQLVNAAKSYRLAGQPDRGLKLLRSFEPMSQSGSTLVGMRGYEIGAALQALGEKKQALAAYIEAAEECPGIIPNSDIVECIRGLGGMPLRDDRDITVRSIKLAEGRSFANAPLVTDGSRLYVGAPGVLMVDPETEASVELKPGLGNVTCLKVRHRELWVGTAVGGVWRCDPVSNHWTPYGTDQGLPDLRVTCMALNQDEVYVGVGTAAAGGLVRIDSQGTIHPLAEGDAPRVAPTHMVLDDNRLLARTVEHTYELSLKSGKWTQHSRGLGQIIATRLFAGTGLIWASNYGHEITVWDADESRNQIFKSAWYNVPGTKAGYEVSFVAERGDEVWFGGQPWDHFLSSGLYRIHRKTGAFHKFSPRDGFPTVYTQSIHDGVWLRDQLWLTTSCGLCVVTPLQKDADSRLPTTAQ
ncbi:MAG: hypothetical protein JSS49_08985 [Planctomycetes bacterium]|nr:hypothetical protein [Planctomycetota bacterium]